MRKFILTSILITALVIAKAQTTKGTIYLGGSTAISNSNIYYGTNGFSKNSRVLLMPTIGVFLSSKWAIGLTPTYQYLKDTSFNSYIGGGTSSSVTRSKLLGGGINLRYYVKLGDYFAFFPQMSVSYLTSVDIKSTHADEHVFVAALSPNFSFFPTKCIAINMGYGGLEYRRESFFPTDGSSPFSANAFGITANNGVNIGVAYHFTK